MGARQNYTLPFIALLACMDTASVAVAVTAATWIVSPTVFWSSLLIQANGNGLYFFSFVFAWPWVAIRNRLYISRSRDQLAEVLSDVTYSVIITLVFSGFAVAFLTPIGAESRFLGAFGALTILIMMAVRTALQLTQWSLHKKGKNESEVLIVGVNDRTRDLVRALVDHPEYGFRLAGVLEDEPDRCRMLEEFSLPYLGKFDAMDEVLIKHVIDEVYIGLPVRSRYETIQNIAHLCEGVGVSVRLIADLFPLRLATSRYHKVNGIPILALSTVPEHQAQLLLQRATDIVVSSLALVGLSPLLLLTALAIKLESKGPVFFQQERVGLNRRRFKMIKFRSMVQNAEDLRASVEGLNIVEGAMFKARNDPRITKVGRFIRRYSIDEFPQFINVLRGDMSLVGPRPALPAEVSQYSWNQRRRLSVKPGVTGLSQVKGRSELSFKDTVDLDLYYIDQWSLGLVFRIMFMTIPAVLRGRGAM